MLSVFFLCLLATAYGQGTTNVETEDDNANPPQPTLYNPGQTFSSYQPAAQQRRPVYTAPVPRVPETYSYAPYSFNYVAQGEDGSSSRQETGDASGRVVGSYTLAVEDGRRRVVEYVADQDGFRATIDTNEPGTEIQNPADVVFHSAGLGRANTQSTVVSRPQPQPQPQPPQTVYRQRPARIYTQPAVVRPVYHREEVFAPYRHYYGHAHDDHGHGHGAAHGSYYHNDHRYYWGH